MAVWIKPQCGPGIEHDVLALEDVGGRHNAKSGVRGEKRFDHIFILGAQKTARRIHEPPPGLHQRRRGVENRALFLPQLVDRGLGLPPLEVGIAPQSAKTAARRVGMGNIWGVVLGAILLSFVPDSSCG